MAIQLVPFNGTLVGWDEWILASIMGRIARWWLPHGKWYDVLVPTGYSYPPLFFWVGGVLAYILGMTPLVLRLGTIMSAAGCTALTAMLGRRVAGPWAAWTAGILATTAVYLNFHDSISMDFMLAFWILLSLYLLLRGLDTENRWLVFAAVFCGGAACFTKYHGVIYHAILCALIIALPVTRRMIRRWYFLMFAGAALALPLLILALEGLTWHFYGFQKTHIAEAMRMTSWEAFAPDPATGAVSRPRWDYYVVYSFIHVGILPCVLFFAGGFLALRRGNRDARILLLVTVLWLLWATTLGMKHPRYLIPAVYLVFVMAGLAVARLSDARGGGYWAAALVLVLTVSTTWSLVHRVRDYLTDEQHYDEVMAVAREKIPEDAIIVVDSLPYQKSGGVGLCPLKQRVMAPVSPAWETKAGYAITENNAYDMLRAGVIQSDPSYLTERDHMVAQWDVLLDVGTGLKRVRVLRQPPNYRFQREGGAK